MPLTLTKGDRCCHWAPLDPLVGGGAGKTGPKRNLVTPQERTGGAPLLTQRVLKFTIHKKAILKTYSSQDSDKQDTEASLLHKKDKKIRFESMQTSPTKDKLIHIDNDKIAHNRSVSLDNSGLQE